MKAVVNCRVEVFRFEKSLICERIKVVSVVVIKVFAVSWDFNLFVIYRSH